MIICLFYGFTFKPSKTSDLIELNCGKTSCRDSARNTPLSFIDSTLLNTLITTYNFGFGSHSALIIETSSQPPFLYYLVGTFPKKLAAKGTGEYQKSTCSKVETTELANSTFQEKTRLERSIEIGGTSALLCASSISGALRPATQL